MTRQTITAHTTLRIGVDTGGTFTDFIAIASARQLAFKIPSTPHAPATAILQGIARILAEFDNEVAATTGATQIVHGTTVATNALLERKGARTALLTTAGFEDVLALGRQARPDLYNFAVTRPAPLVPDELRLGVKERIAPDGAVLERLQQAEIVRLKAQLKRAKIESIAISLLFSFANPTHEQALTRALAPLGVPLSISHQILPEYREYERTSTVVINAYLAPRVSRYVTQLVAGLTEEFQTRQIASNPRSYNLRIMQSSGGSISAEIAAQEPVRTILSGPAGGVVAATRIAALAGYQDIISFDMGGTSTDVALCQGAPRTTNEAQIIGLPVAVPVLDIHTVGAGGGSLAAVDAGGALRVGPESAGADPGPACYGTGSLQDLRATVTDANCVLGRFAGAGLLSGALKLDETRAAAVLDELAKAMSQASALKGGQRFTRAQAALGVIRVANANMEGALRLVSLERGHDPRRFTLVSFGGAGGLHAAALAEALRIPRVLIPAYPGAFSALGVLLADVVKDYSRTVMLTVKAKDQWPRQLLNEFKQMEQQARDDLRAEGFTAAQSQLIRALAMRYRGQSFELEIALNDQAAALNDFHRAHRARYGHADQSRAVEIVSLRLRAVGLTEKPVLRQAARAKAHCAAPQRTASVYLSERRARLPVYEREALQPGAQLNVPSIVVEYGSTTLIPAPWAAQVDRWHNLLLAKSG